MFYAQEVLFCLCFVCLLNNIYALENGLARTPPMGWMSWGYYECAIHCDTQPEKCLNEELILSVADSFYNEGYQEAGFEYIIIDDCWSEPYRVGGQLVPSSSRFPRGMKFLADYIHKKGLKFGMYMNIANVTCMGFPGSRNLFERDMKQFVEWDIDYIKVDGCFNTEEYLNTAYVDLGQVINKTGRPLVYSCSWPYYIKFIHGKTPDIASSMKHCNLWRNFHDVKPLWGSVKQILRYFIEEYDNIAPYHGPGHWNDPDMLIFGTNSLTQGQSRIELAIYAMMSAPLLLSCNMKLMTNWEKSMLLNMELIAIGQDPMGEMAKPHSVKPMLTLWIKRHLPMKADMYPTISIALVNWHIRVQQTYVFRPALFGLVLSDNEYTVMDVFSKEYIRNMSARDQLIITVPPEDVVLYTLYPL